MVRRMDSQVDGEAKRRKETVLFFSWNFLAVAGLVDEGSGFPECIGEIISLPFAAVFFKLFDAFPVGDGIAVLIQSGLIEYMGMTANHLISSGLCHLIKGEKSFLLSKLCMENNLQQEIAKLFPEIGRISGGRENIDAADYFGGFFDAFGLQTFVRLDAVPGAAFFTSELSDDIEELLNSVVVHGDIDTLVKVIYRCHF